VRSSPSRVRPRTVKELPKLQVVTWLDVGPGRRGPDPVVTSIAARPVQACRQCRALMQGADAGRSCRGAEGGRCRAPMQGADAGRSCRPLVQAAHAGPLTEGGRWPPNLRPAVRVVDAGPRQGR
jgi:hypothetical protein